MSKALLAVVLAVMAALTNAEDCPANFERVCKYCLHVSTEYRDGTQVTVTWEEAREKCRSLAPSGGWASDLVTLKDEAKLALISKHIYDNYKDIRSYVFWVGARQVFDHGTLWLWLDDTNVAFYSNIWLPSEPPLETTNNVTILVPAGSAHYRLYMIAQSHGYRAPSYVCEAVSA